MLRKKHLFLSVLGAAVASTLGHSAAPAPAAEPLAPVLGGDLMEPATDAELEQRLEALKPTAPRLTKELIQAVIVDETYTRLEGTNTTVCRLQLANGFCVVGVNNGPVSAANFDQNIGCEYAYKAAVDQIWPLEGYLLAQRLYDLTRPDLTLAASRLRLAQDVLARHAPPDGLSDHDALGELYGILDAPLPEASAVPAYQLRVLGEKAHLDSNRGRLAAFIADTKFDALPADEQWRLRAQHDAMTAYSNVLTDRIAAFPAA